MQIALKMNDTIFVKIFKQYHKISKQYHKILLIWMNEWYNICK